MTKKEKLARLRKLKYLMDHHKEIFKERNVSFNHAYWIGNSGFSEGVQKVATAIKSLFGVKTENVMCNTSACVLGSACLYEPFIKKGLKLNEGVEDFTTNGPTGRGTEKRYDYTPEYKGYVDFEAGQKFFGITENEAGWLFDPSTFADEDGDIIPDSAITTAMVSKRIGYLIKRENNRAKNPSKVLDYNFGVGY